MADLSGADLTKAILSRARLRQSLVDLASLRGASLDGADLPGAKLRQAVLIGASFVNANLRRATLSGADLTDADLRMADLSGANFSDASLSKTKLGLTVLADLDLTPFCAADQEHSAVSLVDYRSIGRSLHAPRLKDFLRRTGMPDVFVEYMVDCARSLDPEQVFSLLQSTFISYGGPDEPFARKLSDALERRGVTTFFFKDDAPAGEKLHRVMRKGVNEHDRVILVCSESSLRRPGLLNELEETLAREARDGGRTYLLPVRLDDYVIDAWNPVDPTVAQAVCDRVIADFRGHEDPMQFETGISKLIAVLKRPGPTAHL